MLICLLIGQGVFFIDQSWFMRHDDSNKEDDEFDPPNVCYNTILLSASTLFLALAVFLNINKWVYFTMRIQANINIREYEIAEMVAEE